MRTSKEIKQLLNEGHDRVKAIMDVAKEEKREWTPEETVAINAFHGEGDELGECGKLEKELVHAEKIETRMARNAEIRLAPKLADHVDQYEIDPSNLAGKKVKVPAQALRHGKLNAFKNSEDAYASGQFLRALICKDEQRDEARSWCRDHGIQMVMTEATNTAGGFLVPNPMEMAIIVLQEQYGVFRQKALNYPMSADSDAAPKLTGGLTVYFPDETTDITLSDVSLGQEKLQAGPMATLTSVSRALSEDSVVLITDLLATQIAQAFATTEDQQGFNGTGTAATYGGKVGIITAMGSASKYTAATGNTAFSTLDDVDFLGMMGLLANYPGIMPEWYISPEGYADSMARITTAAGGVSKAEMEEDLRPRFHGRPVNFVNVMNSTLTAQTSTDGLCYYGDLRMGAILGTRSGTSIAVDESLYFASNRIAVRGWQRNAVNIHDAGDGTNAGAIVGLTTPGS